VKVLILEDYFYVENTYDIIILWNQFENNNYKYISIPQFIEENSDQLKNLYLNIVENIGNFKICKKTILQNFQREDNFNFWWLTSIEQKFNLDDSSGINDILKLLALKEILKNYTVDSITLLTNDFKLKSSIKHYCNHCNIKFNYNNKLFFNLNILANVFSTFFFVIKYIYFCFSNNKIIEKQYLKGDITFFDIFVHLKKESINNKKFNSSYWNDLIEILRSSKISTSWVHLFYSYRDIPKFSNAKKITTKFNKNDSRNFNHLFIEDHLTLNIILKATWTYLKYFPLYFKVFLKAKLFLNNGEINMYYFLNDNLCESLFGQSRIINEIRLLLFDSLFKYSKKQNLGFYIQENQTWELILSTKWKKYNNGTLYGVPHSTLRYWDLRYFDSNKNIIKKKSILPDYILLNSQYAFNLLKQYEIIRDRIFLVEALRYQHLLNFNKNDKSNKIIIFGDFQASTNKKILDCLMTLNNKFSFKYKFYYRQHPAFYFNIDHFKITEDNRNIDEILIDYNIAIISNISSTSAEAFSLGIDIIQYLDGKKLNFSPLKGIDGLYNFKNADELSLILENFETKQFNINKKNNYFELNRNLTRWKKILNINDN